MWLPTERFSSNIPSKYYIITVDLQIIVLINVIVEFSEFYLTNFIIIYFYRLSV